MNWSAKKVAAWTAAVLVAWFALWVYKELTDDSYTPNVDMYYWILTEPID